jgi:hypothetical protein
MITGLERFKQVPYVWDGFSEPRVRLRMRGGPLFRGLMRHGYKGAPGYDPTFTGFGKKELHLLMVSQVH